MEISNMCNQKSKTKTSSFRVYLGGKITTEDDYFRRWREIAEKRLVQAGIVPLNPLMAQEVLNPKDRGLTSSYPSESIMMRDYQMVRSSDLLIANLKLKGDNDKTISDPIVGTFMEIAWSWHGRKPIIAIVEEDNYVFNNHPMLKTMVTRCFSTVDEAVDEVINFWSWHKIT